MDQHSILHDVQPASCRTPWESMTGTDSVRTCPSCKVKIFNVEGLEEDQILELVSKACPGIESAHFNFFRRHDGKLMLEQRNCSLILTLNKLFGVPTVCALLVVLMVLSYLEVAQTHHAYLICGATIYAMSFSFVLSALVGRLINGANHETTSDFHNWIAVNFPHWLAISWSLALPIWLILRSFAPTNWKISNHELAILFPACFLIAGLIAWIPRPTRSGIIPRKSGV